MDDREHPPKMKKNMDDREHPPKMMNERPQRKTPVHLPVRETFNRTIIVFLTVCTEKRKPILARPDIHNLLTAVWIHSDHWRVGRYMVMPDHIHLFCSPGRQDCLPLTRWAQFWKSVASRQWPRNKEQPIWQKSCWDTQLRTGASYSEKWDYVRHNPVRADLCRIPDDWPFQGELNILTWHE
jgi:REP element-mobilizing transposase RayT